MGQSWSELNKEIVKIQSSNSERIPPSAYIKMSPEELLLSIALDGILYDEERAKQGPCECIKTPKGELCWDKGIIGALSKEQFDKYCDPNKIVWKATPKKLQERFETFSEASKECEIGKNGIENLQQRLQCMHLKAQE